MPIGGTARPATSPSEAAALRAPSSGSHDCLTPARSIATRTLSWRTKSAQTENERAATRMIVTTREAMYIPAPVRYSGIDRGSIDLLITGRDTMRGCDIEAGAGHVRHVTRGCVA